MRFWHRFYFSAFLLLVLLLQACQHRYSETAVSDLQRPSLRTKSVVYVAIPPDVEFKKDTVIDSGRLTAEAVRQAFARYVSQAYIGRRPETFAEGLRTAKATKADYFVYPAVLHWEDRATEFTMRADRLEIRLSLLDASTDKLLHEVVLQGRSRLLTDGGDTPEDLLQEPVTRYVSSLFSLQYVPSALR
jgi:hypothetical protein